jgi:gas vesicle protein
MSKNKSSMLLAGMLGALAGAVGGLLLAPKSGKETRKDIAKLASEISMRIKMETSESKARIKDIFGKASEDAMDKYNEVKNTVVGKVASLKTAGEEIDRDKYGKIVDTVISDFKDDFANTKSGAEKIAMYLKKDWEKVKKALIA